MAAKPKPVEELLATAEEVKEESHDSLTSALLAAQRQMKHAPFDAKNPHFKSQYATLQSVIDTVKPALNRNGVMFYQHAFTEPGLAGVETIFIHAETGEKLSTGAVMVPVDRPNAHGFGSALTYAKRYSLAMACGIGSDEDDDGNASIPEKGEAVHSKGGTYQGKSTGRAPQSVAKTVLEEMGTEVTPVAQEAADAIGVALRMEDGPGALQLWDELENDEKAMVWGLFSPEEKKEYKRITQ